MSYLFAAYTLVWIILCAYVFRLAKQGRTLRKEITRLQEQLGDRESDG